MLRQPCHFQMSPLFTWAWIDLWYPCWNAPVNGSQGQKMSFDRVKLDIWSVWGMSSIHPSLLHRRELTLKVLNYTTCKVCIFVCDWEFAGENVCSSFQRNIWKPLKCQPMLGVLWARTSHCRGTCHTAIQLHLDCNLSANVTCLWWNYLFTRWSNPFLLFFIPRPV
jgi:hypothetical protein